MPAATRHTSATLRLLVPVAVAIAILVGHVHTARADNVVTLSRTLQHSRHHKERMSAAVSLGRLQDPRALTALIKALKDRHRGVRAVAAVSLGRIGDDRALAALQKARRDPDRRVRKRAREAIAKIRSGYKVSAGTGDPGFGSEPKTVQRPSMYVTLRSAVDKSDGPSSPRARRRHAARMKRLLTAELKGMPGITTDARVARKLTVARYNLDASIIRFGRTVQGRNIEVECEIRLAISDERGKMLSFMTGSARVHVPRQSFTKSSLARLRIEALEGAVKGVHQDLLAQLRRNDPLLGQ